MLLSTHHVLGAMLGDWSTLEKQIDMSSALEKFCLVDKPPITG